MREEEIKAIFGEYLIKMGEDKIAEALSATYCKTMNIILNSLPDIKKFNQDEVNMIRLGVEIKGSLMVYAEINMGQEIVLIPGGSPQAFLEIYSKFYKIVNFLNENLDNLRYSQRLNKETTASSVKQLLAFISSRLEQIKGNDKTTGNRGESEYINTLVGVAWQLILGDETFEKFIKQTNYVTLVVEQIRNEMVVTHFGKTQKNLKAN